MTASIDDGAGDAQTITDDITNLTIGVPRGIQEVTGIGSSGIERLLLLADLSVGLNGVFNPAATKSHAVFKTVPSQAAEQLRTVSIAISSQILTAETTVGDYVLTRAADGAFTWAVTMVNADGNIPVWGT